MTGYRVLVTSSRTWQNRTIVWATLTRLAALHGWEGFTVVHGAALTGGDEYAQQWACQHRRDGVINEPHPAKWAPFGIYNPTAGFARNTEMVALGADTCVAFIRNSSPGASDCARKAEEAGIPTLRWGEAG
jgi:hypothetical protein